MARLRILILADWYPNARDPVAGSFVRDQARAAARRHDVTVVALDPCVATRADTLEDGLPTIRVPAPAGSRRSQLALLRRLDRVLRDLDRGGRRPDVLHAHEFSAGLWAVLLGRRRRLPVVVSEHLSDFIEGLVAGWDARVARFVFRRAARVCPVSGLLERHLRAFESRASYEVVPNVVDVEAFAAVAAPRRRSAGEPLRLLLVATLARQKGIPDLLAVLPDDGVVLDVAGDGPDRGALEAQAGALAAAGAVRFHGACDRARVIELMRGADALVLPSVVESFGIVVVEALAAGLPVLTTDAVGAAELLDGGLGTVVPAGDRAALGAAIRRLRDAPPEVHPERMAAQARGYSPASVAERWDAVYRSLARPAGGPSPRCSANDSP